MDLISVIVPVYNVDCYLERCIRSIVEQSFSNLEIILVDDGSTDLSSSICDRWEETDPRIKVIHKMNGGLSDARNVGVSIAKGNFIGFVDSDDWIAPEMYQQLYDAIIRDQSDISACAVQMVWESGKEPSMLTISDCKVLDNKDAQKALLFETELKQPVWYKLYRAKLLDGVLFEMGKYHEDVFWSYQVIGKAKKVSLIDYIGYYYWQRDTSIMGSKYSLKRLDVLEAMNSRQRYFEIHYPELVSKGKIAILISSMYHYQQVIENLEGSNQESALKYIIEIKNKNKPHFFEIGFGGIKQKIWVCLALISFRFTCKLRNLLGVGR